MSKRNPFTVPGTKGRLNHKRFPRKAKASEIREAKTVARLVKAIKAEAQA